MNNIRFIIISVFLLFGFSVFSQIKGETYPKLNESYTYTTTITSTPLPGYSWSLKEGKGVITGSNSKTPSITWTQSGSETIILSVAYYNYGSVEYEFPVTISYLPPITGESYPSLNKSYTYTASINTGATPTGYSWTLKEGKGIITDETTTSPSILWVEKGSETLILSVSYYNYGSVEYEYPIAVLNFSTGYYFSYDKNGARTMRFPLTVLKSGGDINTANKQLDELELKKEDENSFFEDEISAQTTVRMYPNPTDALLTVELSGSDDETTMCTKVQLTNSLGVAIPYTGCSSNKAEYNLSSYAPGIYFLSMKQASGTKVWKVIKH